MATEDEVWEKGTVVPDNDKDKFRKDDCGAWIARKDRGERSSRTNFGWEVEHIDPDGSNQIGNLRPLHWANNVKKSDGGGDYCVVKANGTKNVEV